MHCSPLPKPKVEKKYHYDRADMNESEGQYTTLFCEGDGSLNLQDDYYPRLFILQKDRAVLDYIASLQEGGVFHQDKNVWRLVYNGPNCIPLLEVFSRHVVSKRFLDRLNHCLEALGMPLAVQHPLTLDGFVGFWDAEGTSNISPALRLIQKDREILDIATQTFGGYIVPTRTWFVWNLGGDEARKLAAMLMEKSHCPQKVERLKYYFGEQSRSVRSERSKVYNRRYHEKYREESLARDLEYHKKHDAEHKEEIRERHKKYNEKQKLIREYMKAHPEIIDKLSGGT